MNVTICIALGIIIGFMIAIWNEGTRGPRDAPTTNADTAIFMVIATGVVIMVAAIFG